MFLAVDGHLVIRRCCLSVAQPLSLVARHSFQLVKFQWNVGMPSLQEWCILRVSKYKPTSVTCAASRVMERVIVCDLLTYLRLRRISSKQQHGFLSCRSTMSNLLETVND